MDRDKKPSSPRRSPTGTLDGQMRQLNLGNPAPPADTPESVRFRALPQELQRRVLIDYPRILATAMHQYSNGDDCESILMQQFESSSEMLRVSNVQGDAPMAVALLSRQDERAEKLVDLAERRNPAALDIRSQYRESLLMLSTSSSSAANMMERLLQRDPTQLHRLYDIDGRNFLHHCTLEESAEALDAALRLTARLIAEGKLSASQVSAAIHMNDRAGDTPMHMMAARNRCDMLSRLVQFCSEVGIGINVDERQHRGSRWTPLMVAVRAGAAEAVELLVNLGADPTEEDTEGRTAFGMAAGNTAMLRILGEEDAAVENNGSPGEGGATAQVASGGDSAWMSGGQSMPTVDSGMGTCADMTVPSVPKESEVGRQSSLSKEEIYRIEVGLRAAGKESAFLGEFQAKFANIAALAGMTEHPTVSLISQLAHDPKCRSLVQEALRNVGEPRLAGGL